MSWKRLTDRGTDYSTNMTVDDTADASLLGKEVNHSPELDRNKLLASGAMLMSSNNEWPDPLSSMRQSESLRDAVDSKILVACADSKAVSESPGNLNDESAMVAELTLKNYKSPNLSTVEYVNNREEIPLGMGPCQWHHYLQLAGGSSDSAIRANEMLKEQMNLGGEEALRSLCSPMAQSSIPSKTLDGHGKMPRNLSTRGIYVGVGDSSSQSSGGIRTKPFSTSSFHQFFAKKGLKGKGAVHAPQKAREESGVVIVTHDHEKKACHAGLAPNASHGSGSGTKNLSVSSDANANNASVCGGGGKIVTSNDTAHEGVCLREWLMTECRKANKVERLLIFRQILELVAEAHSQGAALQELRPSNFWVLPAKNVRYIGSWGKPVKLNFIDVVAIQGSQYQEHCLNRKRLVRHGSRSDEGILSKHQKLGGYVINTSMRTTVTVRHGMENEADTNDISSSKEQLAGSSREQQSSNVGSETQNLPSSPSMSCHASMPVSFESVQLEERWYASPEELSGRTCTLQSNIYSLGVLFFELFCYFESWELHTVVMSDLRHRILPPNFLSGSAKEAGFCLWLLHPEASSRPRASEILQSEMINEVHHLSSVDDLSLAVDDQDAESDLLLHFLLALKEQKHKRILKLVEDLGCLKEDIEEVERRHSIKAEHLSQAQHDTSYTPKEYLQKSTVYSYASLILQMNEPRLMRNIRQLEHAYFSMRSQIALPDTDARERLDKDVLKKDSRLPLHQNDSEGGSGSGTSTDRLGTFFEGIYKYARYSKFETRGFLRNGDFNSSANVICSLSFDRDEEYFAAAGVSKKIKIFEYSSLLNDMVDIHYPVIEMTSKSKLSCVCWNNYIKNYLASTDYDGVVQLWDASTGQGFNQYAEHPKRAWSVDFSRVDPTKLASGSDDCSVKLWNINEKKCLSTIRNVANVCCVQFSSHSTHLLAFGSADYKVYCYDLRNPRIPWCTLVGHGKAVSYVKFIDSVTLVSASTDNTLKLWDLNKTTSGGLSTNACSLTFHGHTNEKNFVGLSASDGYIACGSETNEVYAYYRSLPMPITSHKFGSVDPISGLDTGDDNGLFVSSVCWRGKSNTVVAANSNGCIKLLQLV